MKVKLHPHQKDAIDKMHNGCVLWGGGGTGKTITSLAYALLRETDKQIVVVTTAKVRDSFSWEKEAAKLRINPGDIQVTSWNKINEFVGYEDHLFIFDEQRIVGSGAWVKAFHKIAKANRWILLSATPGDTWSDYSALFIANGWYKNITEFRREHAIYSRFTTYPKITGWRNEGRLQKYRKKLLVEMPMLRHTTRHIEYVECEYDETLVDTVRKNRWNVYEDKPIENAAEMYAVMRKVVSTDPSRQEALKDLLKKHPKLIVFYNYNYELDILREVCAEHAAMSSSMTSGQTSKNTTEPTPSPSSQTTDPSSDISVTMPETSSDFEQTLPPWELTDEEIAVLLDKWNAEHEGESWESKTPTHSPATTSSAPSSRSVRSPARSASTAQSVTTAPTTSTPRSSDGPQSEPTASDSRASTPSRPTSTEPTTSTSSPSRTTPTTADAWGGTIWGGDWEPEAGTPDPRSSPRSEKAKYEFESKQRKAGSWPEASTESSPSSGTSTTYHKYPVDTSESSSSSEDSGSTKTSATIDIASSITTSPTKPPLPDVDLTGSFEWAEWNGHKHQEIPETDRWVYLVQYQSGAEGWNCIETDAMAFWSLTYSWKLYEQAQCRTDRLNTPFKDLHYYIMMANSPAERPVMMSLEQKKDFQPK